MTTEAKVVGKSKTTAVVLALFLSFWSWLYTYKKDARKFWVGVVLIIIFVGAYVVLAFPLDASATPSSPLATALGVETIALWLVIAVVWVWAFMDAVIKKLEWYHSY